VLVMLWGTITSPFAICLTTREKTYNEAAIMRRRTKWYMGFCLSLIPLSGCGNGGGSSSTQWHYTALGDSLAVGILDSQGGYVVRYKRTLHPKRLKGASAA
jgi:hypothetical protein